MKREIRHAKSERPHGNVVEIFSGIQGEGSTSAGGRFPAAGRCNLACDYCDEPEARTVPSRR